MSEGTYKICSLYLRVSILVVEFWGKDGHLSIKVWKFPGKVIVGRHKKNVRRS